MATASKDKLRAGSSSGNNSATPSSAAELALSGSQPNLARNRRAASAPPAPTPGDISFDTFQALAQPVDKIDILSTPPVSKRKTLKPKLKGSKKDQPALAASAAAARRVGRHGIPAPQIAADGISIVGGGGQDRQQDFALWDPNMPPEIKAAVDVYLKSRKRSTSKEDRRPHSSSRIRRRSRNDTSLVGGDNTASGNKSDKNTSIASDTEGRAGPSPPPEPLLSSPTAVESTGHNANPSSSRRESSTTRKNKSRAKEPNMGDNPTKTPKGSGENSAAANDAENKTGKTKASGEKSRKKAPAPGGFEGSGGTEPPHIIHGKTDAMMISPKTGVKGGSSPRDRKPPVPSPLGPGTPDGQQQFMPDKALQGDGMDAPVPGAPRLPHASPDNTQQAQTHEGKAKKLTDRAMLPGMLKRHDVSPDGLLGPHVSVDRQYPPKVPDEALYKVIPELVDTWGGKTSEEKCKRVYQAMERILIRVLTEYQKEHQGRGFTWKVLVRSILQRLETEMAEVSQKSPRQQPEVLARYYIWWAGEAGGVLLSADDDFLRYLTHLWPIVIHNETTRFYNGFIEGGLHLRAAFLNQGHFTYLDKIFSWFLEQVPLLVNKHGDANERRHPGWTASLQNTLGMVKALQLATKSGTHTWQYTWDSLLVRYWELVAKVAGQHVPSFPAPKTKLEMKPKL